MKVVSYPPDAPVIKANRPLMSLSVACNRSAMSTELEYGTSNCCVHSYMGLRTMKRGKRLEMPEDAVNCQSDE